MGTPEQPEPGRITSLGCLYGECASGINHELAVIGRRALIGGALALPVAAWAGQARRVAALNWEGVAEFVSRAQELSIHVKTRVEPFVPRARSETWLIGRDPRDVRTLIVEGDKGWMERGGARTPLPAAQGHHENQQYAIYGFLVMAAQRKDSGKGLRLNRADCWPFEYDAADGRVTAATYTVDAPDGNGSIAETIRCSDWRDVSGLSWPHKLVIEQRPSTGAGNSIFSLTLDTMTAEFA
ncbi:hypothetical protein OF829_14415 [Sphingomonas sp. LB-2]|uniref:hypothetical protein n=1 Tax=Sphingomonas caeni TaxID=2984949 RepID=UPI00222FB1C0|nr:hypothetical protein [Sphingomonas caeni]MCW3848432.1 hypothetical protein [Sphingomonas caeni]